jgi:hypothetical protein
MIGVHRPLSKIVKAVIVTKNADKFMRFDVDATKANEDNILVEIRKLGYYGVVSIARVFNVEVMNNADKSRELLGKIPNNSEFHNAVVGIEWKYPHLFLGFNESRNAGEGPPVYPITGMVFVAEVSKGVTNYPISHRYKYVNEEGPSIAQVIVARVNSIDNDSYICLVRHHIDDDNRLIGGAFF